MTGFTKLFGSIVHSTVWREPDHVRLVWITMLALADRGGVVSASVPGLADAARVTLPQCVDALKRLSAPDEWSRTPDHDGRRIAPSPEGGGWVLLNHARYRQERDPERRREREAERARRYRERHASSRSVTHRHAPSRPVTPNHPIAEAEAEAEAEKTERPSDAPAPSGASASEAVPVADPVAATVEAMREDAGDVGKAWTRAHRQAAAATVRALGGDGHGPAVVLAAWRRFAADDFWRPKGLPFDKFREHFPRFAVEPAAPKASPDERRRALGRTPSDKRMCRCGHPAAGYHVGAGRCCKSGCDCLSFEEAES